MNEKQEDNRDSQEQDDLDIYLKEMETLESDFSDLRDLDLEDRTSS